MESNVLRLMLVITGVAFVLGIYLWERHKREGGRVHAVRREPEMSAQRLEQGEIDEVSDSDAAIDFDLVDEGVRLRPSKSQSPPPSPGPSQTKGQNQSQNDRVPVPAWALKKSDSDSDALARELGQLNALVKETAPVRRPDAVAKEKPPPQQIAAPPRAAPEMKQAPDAGEQIAFPFAAEDNRHKGQKKDKDKNKKKPRVESERPEFLAPLLPPLPPKILVINVVAKRAPFAGEALLAAAEDCGLRPGDMNIFHLLDQASGGKTLFSMASMVEPGSFPVDDMGAFTTPGVSLFTQLPGPKDGLALFNEMLATAEHLAKCLGGEMQDETHSVLTRQTIEHLRSEITEYQRRRRIARKPA